MFALIERVSVFRTVFLFRALRGLMSNRSIETVFNLISIVLYGVFVRLIIKVLSNLVISEEELIVIVLAI